MKLYATHSATEWNNMLSGCLRKLDMNRLIQVRYQIQAGMTDLEKKKLNTDDMNVWYCRLINSIDKTLRKIHKIKNPMMGDNPLDNKKQTKKQLEDKRTRDQALAAHLHKKAF
jgi:hypothetical protein